MESIRTITISIATIFIFNIIVISNSLAEATNGKGKFKIEISCFDQEIENDMVSANSSSVQVGIKIMLK